MRVTGKNHVVKLLLRLLPGRRFLSFGRFHFNFRFRSVVEISVHRVHVPPRLHAPVRQRLQNRLHVRLRPAFHHPPHRSFEDLQQVVIRPKCNQRFQRKPERVFIVTAPNSRAHRQHVVVAEVIRIPVFPQIFPQRFSLPIFLL